MAPYKIINHFENLKVNRHLAFSNIARGDNQRYTHGYHRYPAKFIPKLANYLIDKYSKEYDLICDPFGGCGTTLVEARLNNRSSIGIDVNPLANLISKVKIYPIESGKLDKYFEYVLDEVGKSREVHEIVNGRLHYWFEEKTLCDLGKVYIAIESIKDPYVRRFFECGFSNILKNCSKWLMSSLKPQVDKKKSIPEVLPTFIKQIKFMIKKNEEYRQALSNNKKLFTKVYQRDARKTNLPSNSIDYIITSPPYVTSYEYADLHQLGLLWFDYPEDWVEFKRKFIGTSHRFSKNKKNFSVIGEDIVDKLAYNSKSISHSVNAYYEDMADFLKESQRILKKGKKISLVIGNTRLKEIDILNAEVAYEQMNNLGYEDLVVEKRETSLQSITPYRDIKSGRFTSIDNPNKRRAYQYEYIITATK